MAEPTPDVIPVDDVKEGMILHLQGEKPYTVTGAPRPVDYGATGGRWISLPLTGQMRRTDSVQFRPGSHVSVTIPAEVRLVILAEACAGFAVEHLLTTLTACVEIDGRQFTVEVDNGSDIWGDGELKTKTKEFHL